MLISFIFHSILTFAAGISLNYTRLYALDGREMLADVHTSHKKWPGPFAVIRSPWEGVGDFGEYRSHGMQGRDDFVLVVSDDVRAIAASPDKSACFGIARVGYPHHLDEAILDPSKTQTNQFHPDRNIRPWMRPEAYFGDCGPVLVQNASFSSDGVIHPLSSLMRNPDNVEYRMRQNLVNRGGGFTE